MFSAVLLTRYSYLKALFVLLHPGWVRTDMGGPQAGIGVADSVTHLRAALASATAADNGAFFNHDGSRLNGW